MCCQMVVQNIDLEITVALLDIGQFERTGTSDLYWRREIGKDESGRVQGVKASIERSGDGTALLRLYLEPSITAYSQHGERRVQASMALELAARVAERVGSEIEQLASVSGCAVSGVRAHKLASYPSVPLQYENLCRGFVEVYGLAV